MEYLITLLIFGIAPPVVMLALVRDRVHWKSLFWMFGVAILIGSVWDYIAISRGIWFYGVGGNKILGYDILGIPIEDFLFFFMIPPWGVGCYELFKKKFHA